MSLDLLTKEYVLEELCKQRNVVVVTFTDPYTNALVEIELPNNYHQAKRQIRKNLQQMAINAHKKKKWAVKSIGSLPQSRWNKKASAILRELKDQGIVLPMGKGPFRFYVKGPQGEPSEEFMELWKKDHVFRAAAVRLVRSFDFSSLTYNRLLSDTLNIEKFVIKNLTKRFRKLLANKKISYCVAYEIANVNKRGFSSERQKQKLDDWQYAPLWVFKSTNIFRHYQFLQDIRKYIKECGRKPAIKITYKTVKELISITHREDSLHLLRSFHNAGGIVPTSLVGLRKFLQDAHQNDTPTYRLLHRTVNRIPWQVKSELPQLPDLNATFEIMQTPEAFQKESKEMHHCIAGYCGIKGLFLSVRRGEESATLFINGDYDGAWHGTVQCQGPYNQKNTLVYDIQNKWVPILTEWIKHARFVQEGVKEPELVTYD